MRSLPMASDTLQISSVEKCTTYRKLLQVILPNQIALARPLWLSMPMATSLGPKRFASGFVLQLPVDVYVSFLANLHFGVKAEKRLW